MATGRSPELDEARRARVEVRLSNPERSAIEDAAGRVGLSVGEWLRVTALTAAGAGDLLSQLRRIEPSLVERVDADRRRRVLSPRASVAPIWTHGPHPHCRVEEMASERLTYEAEIRMDVRPSFFPHEPDEVWPPKRGEPRLRARDLRDPPPGFDAEMRARRAGLTEGLLDPVVGLRIMSAWAWEHGYKVDAVVATNALEDRGPNQPHAFALLRHGGEIETALQLRPGEQADLSDLADLRPILQRQLRLLHDLGAEGPFAVAVSLHGARGSRLRGPAIDRLDFALGSPITEDHLFLPIVEVPTADDAVAALRQPLDALWQESGLQRCHLLDLAQ
jgi:hypothetical protein